MPGVADPTGAVHVYAYSNGSLAPSAVASLHVDTESEDGRQALAFNHASSLLAAAGLGGQVQLWDTAAWQPRQILAGAPAPAGLGLLNTDNVAFSPDGAYVFGGCYAIDGWDAATGAHHYAPENLVPNGCAGLAFAGNRRLLVADYEGGLTLWDLEREHSVLTWSAGEPPISSIAVSPDGSTAAVGSGGLCAIYALM